MYSKSCPYPFGRILIVLVVWLLAVCCSAQEGKNVHATAETESRTASGNNSSAVEMNDDSSALNRPPSVDRINNNYHQNLDADTWERWMYGSIDVVCPGLNSNEDDGIVAISPDGQTLCYYLLKKGWEKDGGPFYLAHLSGNSGVDIHGMGDGITEFFNTREIDQRNRIRGGSISSDGRDFYFATNVHSTNGRHQIWVSHFNGVKWGYPESVGPTINNNNNGSYAPYIAVDGKTLYFTSRRGDGYGGDDIYISTLKSGAWGMPRNAGASINSDGDDALISLDASGEKAYLSRTIDGYEETYVAPIPVRSSPCSMILLSGRVTDSATNVPLAATIFVEDIETGTKIFEMPNDSITGTYVALLRAGHDYGISITKPGYVFHSARCTIPINVSEDKIRQDCHLQKLAQGERFASNGIFFNYNEATIQPKSGPELDRLVTMMKDYPHIAVQINGYTDNIGSNDFNKSLSLRRAEAIKEYLVKTGGILPDRITTEGFGFTKPIAPNSTKDGREQNRRTEFTFMGDTYGTDESLPDRVKTQDLCHSELVAPNSSDCGIIRPNVSDGGIIIPNVSDDGIIIPFGRVDNMGILRPDLDHGHDSTDDVGDIRELPRRESGDSAHVAAAERTAAQQKYCSFGHARLVVECPAVMPIGEACLVKITISSDTLRLATARKSRLGDSVNRDTMIRVGPHFDATLVGSDADFTIKATVPQSEQTYISTRASTFSWIVTPKNDGPRRPLYVTILNTFQDEPPIKEYSSEVPIRVSATFWQSAKGFMDNATFQFWTVGLLLPVILYPLGRVIRKRNSDKKNRPPPMIIAA